MSCFAAGRVRARPAAERATWPPISSRGCGHEGLSSGARSAGGHRFTGEEITDVDKRTTSGFKRLKIGPPPAATVRRSRSPFVAGAGEVVDIEACVVPAKAPCTALWRRDLRVNDLQRGRLRLAAKTFALPQVEVGSIIDYRYKIVHSRSEPFGQAPERSDR
ncbi:MAG: hypothetical protein MZV64_49455 [Ignavibacteriales bacterium]|nr:hypothetical protein [Ignavibacteriales bacterium]